jgi:hypothetical protein
MALEQLLEQLLERLRTGGHELRVGASGLRSSCQLLALRARLGSEGSQHALPER